MPGVNAKAHHPGIILGTQKRSNKKLVAANLGEASCRQLSLSSWHHPTLEGHRRPPFFLLLPLVILASSCLGIAPGSCRGRHPGIILPQPQPPPIILPSSWPAELQKSDFPKFCVLGPRPCSVILGCRMIILKLMKKPEAKPSLDRHDQVKPS